jgi:hypothetical protein
LFDSSDWHAWRNFSESIQVNPLYGALTRLQKRLTDSGIPSAIIGGIAVSIWSRPRATYDVDVKILLKRDEAERLLNVLGEDYSSLQDDPLDALRRHGILFVKDESGIRLDLQLADTSFDESAIHRAIVIELEPGLDARICTAEDLIIYKMISTRLQDRVDVENVYRRQGNKLDDRYVLKWLRLFERALDDSTLVATYQRLRHRF